MALVAISSAFTATELRANFDDATALLLTNARAGAKDRHIFFRTAALVSGSDVSLRSTAWTQQDDQEVRMMSIGVTAGSVFTIGATLTVDNGDTLFLVDQTISISHATVNGTNNSRPTSLDLRTTTGTRIRLVKGVRYRLALTNTSGSNTTVCQVTLQMRSVRRRA